MQKSPSRIFGQNSGNSVDISMTFFESNMEGGDANDVDVQRMQCPAELDHAIAADRILPVDPEHPVLVQVKRYRLAVALQIRSRRRKIIEGALALDKLQMRGCGSVDVLIF
jgi:hypothetical protein